MAKLRNADRIRELYDAWNRRAWNELACSLAPDVVWFHATRHEHVEGVDAVVSMLRSTAEAFPDARIDLHAVREAGNTVIAEWSARQAGTRTRAERALVCEVLQFEGDACVRGTTYGDPITSLIEARPADVIPIARMIA